MAASGVARAATAWIHWARPISRPSAVTIELFDMFCALYGATRNPRRASTRHNPVTTTLLPASDVVPAISNEPGTHTSARDRRDAIHPRMPRTPTVVPMTSEAAMSNACTQRNPVGEPLATSPPDHARLSSQMASAKRGQITQAQTPTKVRNTDHFRLSLTGDTVYAGTIAANLRGPRRSAGHDQG